MSDQYVGEIRMFAGNFAPLGWAFCDGSLLSISEYELLFTVLGTTYGGDGQTTFALPDLRGRVPVHMGTNPQTGTRFVQGQKAGVETVTLLSNQLPAHSHTVFAQTSTETVQTGSPANATWAPSDFNRFSTNPPDGTMSPSTITYQGGSQPHDNMMPFLTVSFIIATEGIYPSQN